MVFPNSKSRNQNLLAGMFGMSWVMPKKILLSECSGKIDLFINKCFKIKSLHCTLTCMPNGIPGIFSILYCPYYKTLNFKKQEVHANIPTICFKSKWFIRRAIILKISSSAIEWFLVPLIILQTTLIGVCVSWWLPSNPTSFKTPWSPKKTNSFYQVSYQKDKKYLFLSSPLS